MFHFSHQVATSSLLLHADASIWLYQFIRAMRTPDGEMMKNAHLLGFFRRICK
jgi:DNA excision repair protein ERCC-5